MKHSSIYGSKICRHSHWQKNKTKQSNEITFFFWQAKRKQRISLGRHTADSVLHKSISLNAYREHQRVLLTVRQRTKPKNRNSLWITKCNLWFNNLFNWWYCCWAVALKVCGNFWHSLTLGWICGDIHSCEDWQLSWIFFHMWIIILAFKLSTQNQSTRKCCCTCTKTIKDYSVLLYSKKKKESWSSANYTQKNPIKSN